MHSRHIITTLLLLLFVAPASAQAQAACVTDYDPDTDYFVEEATFTYTENVTVEYFNNYKVVTVQDAFDGADAFQYVLVQCGTPQPTETFPTGTQFVEVPVDRVIALSTTQLPHLQAIGRLDALVGLDSFLFVNTPEVVDLIVANEVVEVGAGADINVEVVINTEADVVMAFGFNPDTDAHPILIDAGIPTALNASWREANPLGRAEWMKFTALFFNEEVAATTAFEDIVTNYEAARELAAGVPADERPMVLWNWFSPFSEAWRIPGAETYAAALINDAGGVIALGEEAPEDSAPFSFEVVYEGGLEADVWVLNAFGIDTLDAVLESDERYADFEALQSGNIWNNNLDVNENGGNNYFELGVTNPDLILRDLVALFHPQLLPDHEFVFYRRLVTE